MALGLIKAHLGRVILDKIGNLAETHQPDLAVLAIDLSADVVFLAVFRAAGLLNRLLHGIQYLVPIDAFVTGNGFGNLEQLGPGKKGSVHRVFSEA